MDKTYVDGREGNKHSKKKLRAGRSGVGKAVVVGAKDRATNSVSAKVVKETDAETLQGFVGDVAAKGDAPSTRTITTRIVACRSTMNW